MSTASVPLEEASVRRAPVWLSGPAFDLVVGCGAWSLPLLALVYVVGSRYDTGITLAFYVISIFCNYPHYMATVYRAYRTRAEATKYKLFTLHITLLLVLTTAFVHWSPAWAPIFFTIYTTWSPWHYTGQNFGIAMMFARRSGATPTRADRNWLWVAFAASYGMILLTLHTGPSQEQYILSLNLPQGPVNAVSVALLVVFVGAAARGMWPLVSQAGVRAMVAPLTVLSTQLLWFVVPSLLVGVLGAELKRTSYSIGVLAFMHCAQYLWITSYYAKRDAEAGRSQWRPWAYGLALVAGGVALFLPGPWLVSYVFRYDFTSSFLIFSALVNLHHFVVDGAIWKLRDSRVASLLVGSRTGEATEADTRPWTEGWRPVARALRVAAVAALFAVAAVDVARFAFSLDSGRTSSLETAARLNPFDVPVRAAIARAQANAGMPDAAIETLRRAVEVGPYDVAAQRQLAKLLLESGRYEEAYRQHAEMVRRVTVDVDTLVNYGTLAAQVGHDDEAADAFSRALELDDNQPIAHLRLAEAYARRGRTAAAIPHFERYIALATSRRDALGDVEQFVRVLVATGDAYASERKAEPATVYYRHAAEFARQAGDASLEGASLGRLAAMLDRAGRRRDAALVYVMAIERDEAARDAGAAATEWFNYGELSAARRSSGIKHAWARADSNGYRQSLPAWIISRCRPRPHLTSSIAPKSPRSSRASTPGRSTSVTAHDSVNCSSCCSSSLTRSNPSRRRSESSNGCCSGRRPKLALATLQTKIPCPQTKAPLPRRPRSQPLHRT